ncbi:hypothetical protein Q6D67_12215 [Haliea sp. E1-2-M8]|uniref:hypothetical protein n=1 Tax=Haliea sp. E1-2-M8 TaxID=3064706 RepID=UPI00271D4F5C|nr:hypothetical protein [Haliea sp. E1-2-M8]MDO8862466.1 hypothetical protein [Haliea sp. E1-2-M8]
MIDFQALAKPAPEQAQEFIADEAKHDARALADGLREVLRLMAEAEFKKLRGYSDEV